MSVSKMLSQILGAFQSFLIGVAVMAAVLIAVMLVMASYENYQAAGRNAKAQYACGEYGNGRAWNANKRKDFLRVTAGGK